MSRSLFYPREFKLAGSDAAETEHGTCELVYPELWDASCVLATLGPQPPSLTARDHRRNNHGTLTNEVTWFKRTYRGKSFGDVYFYGATPYGSFPVQQVTKEATWGGWVYPYAVGAYYCICAKGTVAGGDTSAYSLNIGPTGDGYGTYARYRNNSGTGVAAILNTDLAINTWTHLIGRYDGAAVTLWKNGVQVATNAQTGTVYASTDNFTISSWGGTQNYYFGEAASFFVHTRALSAIQIATLALHPLEAYRCHQRRVWFTPVVAPPAGIIPRIMRHRKLMGVS